MNSIDEADLAVVVRQDERVRAGTFAEEADSTEKAAAGDAGAGKDDFLAGRELVGFVDALRVFNSHLGDAFVVLGFGNDKTRENFTIEATQSCRGEDALWRAAGAHDGVDAGADDGCAD